MQTNSKSNTQQIAWYHYLLSFMAALFLTNALPHFLNGISGNQMPTPFANPPGKGLSSPIINTYWGLGNIAVGLLFYNWSRLKTGN